MEIFIKKDFKIKKYNWGIEYLTKKTKLLGRKPDKIRIGDEIFTYYRSEHMPLSGMKYIYTNKENIAIFW
jgi:hypothetical protein